jgi:hypothetical protein
MHIFNKRQGQMGFQQAYFYRDTIHNFHHLLTDDHLKMMVCNRPSKSHFHFRV